MEVSPAVQRITGSSENPNTRVVLTSPSTYTLHYHLSRLVMKSLSVPANMAFSPYVLDTAITMLYFGTAGDSAEQLRKFYFHSQTAEEVVRRLDLQRVLDREAARHHSTKSRFFTERHTEADDQNREFLDMATQTFLDEALHFPEYNKLLEKYFNTCAQQSDFRSQPETERKKINEWVAGKTENKIPKLLPPGSIASLTRLVLVAALYFKGSWMKPFEPLSDTFVFHSIGYSGDNITRNEVVKTMENVRYMELSAKCDDEFCFGYYDHTDDASRSATRHSFRDRPLDGDGLQVLEIPYKGRSMCMIILMPDNPLKLSYYEELWSRDPETVESWITRVDLAENRKRLKGGVMNTVRLPYFSITPSSAPHVLDISTALKTMGITDIFDHKRCNLSNIDKTAADLIVGGIYHSCTVEVDEKGTEAAAAAAVEIIQRCLPVPGLDVIIDRPFVFQIRQKASTARTDDLVFFMGRVVDALWLQRAG